MWTLPCTTELNISFVFSGVVFPVHPLDLTTVSTIEVPLSGTNTNVTFCFNTFQYLTLDPEDFTGFDAVFGDAFLRNVYASYVFLPYNHTHDPPS